LPELDYSRTIELPSYDDRNFRVFENAAQPRSWVVKCVNAGFVSEDRLRLQAEIMEALVEHGVSAPRCVPLRRPPLGNNDPWFVAFYDPSGPGNQPPNSDGSNGVLRPPESPQLPCLVHVTNFIDDSMLFPDAAPKSATFLRHLGGIVAQIGVGMQDFFDPVQMRNEAAARKGFKSLEEIATFTWEWSCCEIPKETKNRLHLVSDTMSREEAEVLINRVADVLPLDGSRMKLLEADWSARFSCGTCIEGREVAPRHLLNPYRLGFLHSDINDTNVLFSQCDRDADVYTTSAILDFGDSTRDYSLLDIGITAAYACMHQELTPVEVLAVVVRGYVDHLAGFSSSAAPSTEELEVAVDLFVPMEALRMLYGMTLARKLLSAIMGAEQIYLCPGDEYVAHTVEPVWNASRKHLELGTIEDCVAATRKAVMALQY